MRVAHVHDPIQRDGRLGKGGGARPQRHQGGEALDAGIPPKQVWAAVWKALELPARDR